MSFWYKLFTYLFYILSPLYFFFRKLKKKEHPIRYKEKLSKIKIKKNTGFLTWFHVASVGEAMSVLPLIEKLKESEKVKTILITSITVSSATVLEKKFLQDEKVIHQFLPLDVPVLVNKFLNHWSPDLCIFIDSEIWPNLIFGIKNRNIPLLLVNGRITKKTFQRWNYLKKFSKKVFEKFDLCLTSNRETETYLQKLGAKNIKNYGNIKFANTKTISKDGLSSDFLFKIKNRTIWCAASTHPTEEIFCVKTHMLIKKYYKNILTIIIPRHINRIQKITEEISKENLKVCHYKNFKEINSDTDILLIDTYGESSKFYQISKCVFLGKSLNESLSHDSGQNPIEASRMGCKIFHGPYITNFSEIYKYLKSLGVTHEISSSDELSKSLVDELKLDKTLDKDIVKKIENYGIDTLNNVFREIKIYIDK
ncbi:3-deoxy-D-manno-octulosonic acid transferase [Pelagibacteraceae bacterium]|nr:3-deoxy-D-manno-octulosonic acid transferase [Pelagibacteraceae bacterium]